MMDRFKVTEGKIKKDDRVYIFYDGWVKHVVAEEDEFLGDAVNSVDIVYRMMHMDEAIKKGFQQAKKSDFSLDNKTGSGSD